MYEMKSAPVIAPPEGLISAFRDSLKGDSARLVDAAMAVVEKVNAPLYLVGGPVRDLLQQRAPADVDLALEGDAAKLAGQVAASAQGRAAIHDRFGTATVRAGGAKLDLATARTERYARPGVLPKVSASTIEEDLQRRDFTVNAMALGLSGRHAGRLLDPVGGLADLSSGTIRVLHSRSFMDDATRIFRAIRYEQRFGFRIHEETLTQMDDALASGMLATVSADRLRRELGLILGEKAAVRALLRAGELGVLQRLYPPLERAQWLAGFGNEGDDLEPLTLLSALAYGMSAPQGQGFAARLNMPSDWADAVSGMTSLAAASSALDTASLSNSALYRMLEGRPIVSVCALKGLTKSALIQRRLTDFLGRLRFVRPLLRGGDLVAMGVSQGPMVGDILREILDARLDDKVATKEDERALVLKILADS